MKRNCLAVKQTIVIGDKKAPV